MFKVNSQKNYGRIMIIATALLWGLAGVCVKSIPWNSISIMAARCFIGIIMFGIYNRSFSLKYNKKTFVGAAFMSLTGLLYMMSIKMTTAATAIVLQYVAPIFVFLYSVVFQKLKPKISQIIIVLVVFGGCFLSFADQLDVTHIAGNILGVASGISFAAQIIMFNDKEMDSMGGMYLSNVLSFVVCFPFMFFDKGMDFSPKTIFWVLVLGIFQYGLANIFYAKGCQKIDKIESSLLLTIEPIFNPIPVAIVCGETPGPLAIVGFAVVIAGVTAYGMLPVIEEKLKKAKCNK